MVPPRVVLAATDFSDSSRVALACAARLAAQCRAALHVLHAEDPLLDDAARAAGIDLPRETRAELQDFVTSTLGPSHATRHVVTGPAVEVIRDIAARERADIVVIAAHGMSGAERAIFGSTAEGVLRKADVSVLVVPDTWKPARPDLTDLTGTGPLVAAVDLSMPAMAAAGAACRLAAVLGTSVVAVHVVPSLPVLARWSAHAEHAVRQRIASSRAELSSALRHIDTKVPIELHVETGRVADRIAEAVTAAAGQPFLVLGRRSQRDRGGAPGSTAYRVLTIAQVPVLMYLPEE
jgi:nucleotide-binding universal stress UspA family protein